VNVEHAVRELLATDAALGALVGGRVYQLKLPQNVTLPAVRVQLISEPRENHLRGPMALTVARVQADAYAAESSGGDPYASASDVADAIDAALAGIKRTVSSTSGARHLLCASRITRRPLYEADELREVRISQDFYIFSVPTVAAEGEQQ
jgi:hypothetical protein